MCKNFLQYFVLFLGIYFFLFSFVYTEEIIVQTWNDIISENQITSVLDYTWTNQTNISFTWENLFSWINEEPLFTPFLRFVEIFPKDTLSYWEYFVISTTQNFSWPIRFVWAWTSNSEKQITVTLEINKPCVFTDRPELFWTWNGLCLYYIPSMTLTDSGEPLEMREWSNLHHKIIYTWSLDNTPLHWFWIINNDWYEFFSPSLPFFPVSYKEYVSTINMTWTNTNTWDILSWNNNQWSWDWQQQTWEQNNIQPQPPFLIEEIYPFDDLFSEYIEIVALQKRNWTITLYWWWQWTASKSFFIETVSWTRRIITDNKNRFWSYPFVVELDSLSLTDWWEELALLLPTGQEIDRVVYFWQTTKNTLLFDNNFTWSMRLFTLLQPPTPWYTRSMIQHHFQLWNIEKNPTCSVFLQHTTPVYVTNRVNIQAMVDNNVVQNNTSQYQCERLFSGSDIQYLTWCNPTYLSFEVWIQPIFLRVSKNEKVYCETTAFLNLPLEKIPLPKTVSQKTEDKPSYYEQLYHKWKWRFEYLSSQIKWFGYKVNSSGDIVWVPENIIIPELLTQNEPPQVRIHHILPDPNWKDSLWEAILLENLTTEEILSDNLLVVRGKSSKWLPKWYILPPNSPVLITWDIWLVNKPSCFQLRTRQEKKIVSTLCYPQISEWQIYTGNLATLATPAEQERLQNLKLTLTDTESCVWIWIEKVLCKQLVFNTQEVKQRKKDAKKLISVNKKLISFQEKYTLRREKYAKQSASYKKKESDLLSKNRLLRTDISKQKKLTSRFRSLYWLIRNEVWKEFAPLFSSPLFKNLTLVYDTLEIADNTDIVTLWPVQFPIQEVDALYDLYAHGILPLEFVETSAIQEYMHNNIQTIKIVLWSLFE